MEHKHEHDRERNLEALRKETDIERYSRENNIKPGEKAPQYGPFGNYPNRIVGDGVAVVAGWR